MHNGHKKRQGRFYSFFAKIISVLFPNRFNKPLLIPSRYEYVPRVEAYLREYEQYFAKAIEICISNGLLKVTDRDFVLDTAERINTIVKILDDFNVGNRVAAIKAFQDLMASYERVLSSKFFVSKIDPDSKFYRFRTDAGVATDRKNKRLAKKYILFHIPFKLRRKVTNLRFNGQGLPCLYCANSLETAWIESKSPGEHALPKSSDKKGTFFHGAIFKNIDHIDHIDLSLKNINTLYNNALKDPYKKTEFTDYILLYPLIIAFHTKIKYPSNEWVGFNNEYVFPTFFMDWFLGGGANQLFSTFDKVNCIKYSSVEVGKPLLSHNYVFPAKYEKGKNYCSKLESMFLNPGKYFYLFQDRLPKGIVKISKKDLVTIDSIFTSHC